MTESLCRSVSHATGPGSGRWTGACIWRTICTDDPGRVSVDLCAVNRDLWIYCLPSFITIHRHGSGPCLSRRPAAPAHGPAAGFGESAAGVGVDEPEAEQFHAQHKDVLVARVEEGAGAAEGGERQVQSHQRPAEVVEQREPEAGDVGAPAGGGVADADAAAEHRDAAADGGDLRGERALAAGDRDSAGHNQGAGAANRDTEADAAGEGREYKEAAGDAAEQRNG